MNKEAYVSFEVAQLLKEKGFREITLDSYRANGQLRGEYKSCNIPCPTHQMAMAWLRENHNICITIYPDKKHKWEVVLYDIGNNVEITLHSFGIFGHHIYAESYSEAVEEALKYVLEKIL